MVCHGALYALFRPPVGTNPHVAAMVELLFLLHMARIQGLSHLIEEVKHLL